MDNNEHGTNLAQVGTDCISRQAAIDALNEYFDRIGKLKRRGLNKGEKAIRLDTVGTINSLPPAEPKRGRWISADAMFHGVPFYCSECGENTRDTVMGKPRWKFCPNCGADMRERKERTVRAIDADALKEDLTRFYDNEVTARKLIDEQPTIQPEIVRCKDCKYAEYINDVQTLWCTECGQGRTVAPYDFCSYGEMREDE